MRRRTHLKGLGEAELEEIKNFIEERFEQRKSWTNFELRLLLKNRFNLHLDSRKLVMLLSRIDIWKDIERKPISAWKHGIYCHYISYQLKEEKIPAEMISRKKKLRRPEDEVLSKSETLIFYVCNLEFEGECEFQGKNRSCLWKGNCNQKLARPKKWRVVN